MDLQYGVAVANKFAIFFDDDMDPSEILRQKEEESKASKTDKKKASKAAKKPAGAATTESKPKQQEQVKREEKPSQPRQNERGGGRGSRGRELRENDGSRPPRRQGPREFRDGFKGDENVPPEFRERSDFNRRERGEPRGEGGFERGRPRGRGGRGRGRGGPRPEGGRGGGGGGGGFSGPQGDRRREFDRHSGTDKTEADTSTSPADVSGEWAPSSPTEQTTETADLNESGEAPAAPKEEEPKEMTLDEWKALQDQKRMKNSFNIRKAGEGVDSSQWKKGVAYKKKQSTEEEEESEEEEEEEDEDRHTHRKQLVTDIRITFADTPRRGGRGGRGGRGVRGGSRGARGGFGGPDRGDRPNRSSPREAAPRMDDETDFPRLVKSEA